MSCDNIGSLFALDSIDLSLFPEIDLSVFPAVDCSDFPELDPSQYEVGFSFLDSE